MYQHCALPTTRGEMNDHELIRMARDGNVGAFEELVYRHDRSVLSITARYVTSSEEAKDIYQEVFLRVFRNLKDFRFQSEFSTWLYRITVNVCLTHLSSQRSSGRRQKHHDESGDDSQEDGDIADTAEGPDGQAVQSDIAEHVHDGLARLAPKHRMVFTLRHLEGYSLKEIAAMMDCAEGTVKRYLFDATRKMRNHLKDFA